MKKALRRALSVLCALALTVSCLAVTAFAADDLAIGGTPFVDTVNTQYCSHPDVLLDGDRTGDNSRWQSNVEMNDTESETSPYLGVAWSSAKTFNEIDLYWEASDPASDGISVYYATSPASLTVLDQDRYEKDVYTDNGTEWIQATGYTQNYLENGYHKITLADAVTAYAVKVVTFKAQDKNKFTSCYEIEVYDFSVGTPYDLTQVKAAQDYVGKAFGTENVYGYSTASWSAYTAAYAKVASAITACDNKMIGDVTDYATQEALDALATRLYEAAAKLTGDGTPTENVLANGIMIYDKADMQSYAKGNNFRTLTDGSYANNDNSWQPKTAKGSYVYLKLNNAADIEKLAVYAESTGEEYTIQTTTADVTAITTVADMDALTWSEAAAIRDYAVDLGGGTAYQSYYFETVQEGVTAIKVTCSKDNGGWCKLREVEAYGAGKTNSSFAANKVYATDGGDTKFFVTNLAEEDVPEGKILKLSFELTNTEDKVATAEVTVDAAYSMIVLGENNICAGTLENANAGDYMVGVSFIKAANVTSITLVSHEFIDA